MTLSIALYTVNTQKSATVAKLQKKNASLKLEVSRKIDQLKIEQSRVDALMSRNAEARKASSISKPAQPQLVSSKKKVKAKARKRKTRSRVRVSRGAVRTFPAEPTVRQVGVTYWSDEAQLDALVWICCHESIRPGAVSANGCKGLFQLINPPRWMKLGDAASETKAGCEYIQRRYGTPSKAKSFWLGHGWY
jgi:hypothetical protein